MAFDTGGRMTSIGMQHMKRQTGFTLIEVMIVVVIVAILAAIAFPSYQEYVLRGNRTEGQALLSDATARQQRYFAQNNTYADTPAKLGLASDMSTNNLYKLAIEEDSPSYTLTAIPQNAQTRDTKCGNLTLDHKGSRGKSGSAAAVSDCWR